MDSISSILPGNHTSVEYSDLLTEGLISLKFSVQSMTQPYPIATPYPYILIEILEALVKDLSV